MDLSAILRLVENYVTDLYHRSTPAYLTYHNLAHTCKVVAHTIELTTYYQMNEENTFILTMAAWFHDIGHLFTDMKHHEEKGGQIMRSFLLNEQVDERLTDRIYHYIMMTKYPPEPLLLMDGIICDADTYHFGTPEFLITDELIKNEMQIRLNDPLVHWYEGSLKLLETHKFFTSYCRDKLTAGKKQNIEYLKRKITA